MRRTRKYIYDNAGNNKNIKNRSAIYIAIVLLAILATTMVVNQRIAKTGISGGMTETQDVRQTGVAQDEAPAQDTRQEQDDSPQAAAGGSDDSGSQASAPSTGFPLKVTDANGDEMIIKNEPKRIISLTLGSDEMLLGLIDKSRIAALTRYADDAGISNIAEEAAGIPERVSMDQVEKIISLQPDLILLDTWVQADYIKQLRDAGITVYAFRTPCNIDEQKAVIKEIAHLVGADEKGEEIVRWMDEKLDAVEEKLARIKPEERRTVMDYGEMGSSGRGTNFDDIVTRAGLVNVVARAGMTGWPMVSKEQIIEFNPDIIILPSWYYDPKNSLEGMINTLKGDASLSTVNAIKNDRLITVPNQHISAISQYVVLAVEDVARAAYPELFE
ncbi:MAG: ABC transporter substrate-binding protein [Bacillota bacterium]